MFAQSKRVKDAAQRDPRATPNPWLPRVTDSAPTPPASREVQLTGPSAPQRGVEAVADAGLPTRDLEAAVSAGVVGVLGCHGGSGERSLATILDGYACRHAWPAAGGPLVLCARTTGTGLKAAQAALAQWGTAGSVTAEVLGLALVQDAPGRRPKPLRDLERIVASGAPRVWEIPWIAQWRDDQARLDTAPRQVNSFIADVQTLLTQRSRRA